MKRNFLPPSIGISMLKVSSVSPRVAPLINCAKSFTITKALCSVWATRQTPNYSCRLSCCGYVSARACKLIWICCGKLHTPPLYGGSRRSPNKRTNRTPFTACGGALVSRANAVRTPWGTQSHGGRCERHTQAKGAPTHTTKARALGWLVCVCMVQARDK